MAPIAIEATAVQIDMLLTATAKKSVIPKTTKP